MKDKIQRLVDELTGIFKAEGLSPTNVKALALGRDWLKTGCRYSNHDIDVSMGLKLAIQDTLLNW